MQEIHELRKDPKVMTSVIDQCMNGLRTWGQDRKVKYMEAKTTTRFLTISNIITEQLETRCEERHEHQALIRGRVTEATPYPEQLCNATCQGLKNEKKDERPPQDTLNLRMTVRLGDSVGEHKVDKKKSPITRTHMKVTWLTFKWQAAI